jgi:hypothetical protein
MFFWWVAFIIVNVLKFNRKLGGRAYNMPKCKNGKVVLSRFKAQGLIGSKCHHDFHRE